jgi:hypothetical protein
MSLAEEMLNNTSKGIPVHSHSVPDSDAYFVIDPITRKIENTNRKKTVIMQYDHNSERFTFELPRYVDGHDMLECTSVTVNVNNIEVVDTKESDETEVVETRVNSDAPDMTDLRVHPEDPEKVISSWLISRNSTQLAGILSFHIEYKCTDANGDVVYEWATDSYDKIVVKARKKNGEAAVMEYTDILEQWRASIFGAGDSVMANITAEGEAQVAAVKAESTTQQAAVELKGAQTLDSIPEDYTDIDAMADEAVRSKSDAIVCEVSGDSIAINDSSNDYIRGLKLFGKSTQVTTNGYQLFDASALGGISKAGATITNNGNGSFTISGSGTLTDNIAVLKDYTHDESIRMLKLGMLHCPLETTMPYCYIQIRNSSTIYFGLTHSRPSYEITQNILDDEEMYIRIGFYGGAGEKIIAGDVKPMLYQDGDGTWEPFSGGKPAPNPDYPQEIVSVENQIIGVYGKNLIDPDQLDRVLNKSLTVSDDKYTITVIGGSNNTYAYSYYNMPDDIVRLLGGRRLRLSIDSASKSVVNAYSPVQINITCYDNTSLYPVCHSGHLYHDFILPKNAAQVKVGIYTNNSSNLLETDNTVVVKGLRLTLVDNPEYEPYKPYQTITLPRSVPGIPVTSGGNYTDSDGQQWICDEIDLERGVLVKRCDRCVFDGSDDEVWDYEEAKELFKLSYLNVNKDWNVLTNAGRSFMRHYKYNESIWNETVTESGYCINFNSLFIRHKNIVSLYSFKEHIATIPIELTCALSTPIETPLTAEEITAFKALRTNYPNTTILNDAGAWMSVKYNADTKTYVENPKTLKLVDSSTGVVYELKIVDGVLTANPV